jgi:hypothetical protein
LRVTADLNSGVLAGYFRINSDDPNAWTQIPTPTARIINDMTTWFSTSAKAGVLASNKSNTATAVPAVTAVFDRFSVTAF